MILLINTIDKISDQGKRTNVRQKNFLDLN